MENISDEENLEFNNIDTELLELTQIIDLIKSNSAEQISELLQPINPRSSDKGCDMESEREENEQRFGINKFLSVASARYSDREKLISCIRELASTLGFIAVIKKSKKDRYVRIDR